MYLLWSLFMPCRLPQLPPGLVYWYIVHSARSSILISWCKCCHCWSLCPVSVEVEQVLHFLSKVQLSTAFVCLRTTGLKLQIEKCFPQVAKKHCVYPANQKCSVLQAPPKSSRTFEKVPPLKQELF